MANNYMLPSFCHCEVCEDAHTPKRFWKLTPQDPVTRKEWEEILSLHVGRPVSLRKNGFVCDEYFLDLDDTLPITIGLEDRFRDSGSLSMNLPRKTRKLPQKQSPQKQSPQKQSPQKPAKSAERGGRKSKASGKTSHATEKGQEKKRKEVKSREGEKHEPNPPGKRRKKSHSEDHLKGRSEGGRGRGRVGEVNSEKERKDTVSQTLERLNGQPPTRIGERRPEQAPERQQMLHNLNQSKDSNIDSQGESSSCRGSLGHSGGGGGRPYEYFGGGPSFSDLDGKIEGEDPSSERLKLLLCACGSVASVKIPLLISKLITFCDVVLVYSFKAVSFLDRKAIPQSVKMINDDVLKNPSGEEVFVTLCHWADVCLFAPITANTLAKLANGLCDTLMTMVARGWEYRSKDLFVAPAMNTLMYEHSLTHVHLHQVQSYGAKVIPSVAKRLACGDVGMGAMAEVDTIVSAIASNQRATSSISLLMSDSAQQSQQRQSPQLGLNPNVVLGVGHGGLGLSGSGSYSSSTSTSSKEEEEEEEQNIVCTDTAAEFRRGDDVVVSVGCGRWMNGTVVGSWADHKSTSSSDGGFLVDVDGLKLCVSRDCIVPDNVPDVHSISKGMRICARWKSGTKFFEAVVENVGENGNVKVKFSGEPPQVIVFYFYSVDYI